jgi:hypothetical protein
MTNPAVKLYTASTDAYVDGVYYKAGEPFATSQPKGSTWQEADPVVRDAANAASKTKHVDVDLSGKSPAELRAYAAAHDIQVGDDVRSAKDILAIIHAADEPAL